MSEERYYCTRPFEYAEIDKMGKSIFPCCPAMVNRYSYGDYSERTFEDIWNGKEAQDMRQSIIDGSFKYCNENSCPYLQSKTYCVKTLYDIEHNHHSSPEEGKIIADDIKNKRTVLDHGPHNLQLAYDQSCQLKCPSCRIDVIMAKGVEKKRILELQERIIEDMFPSARSLFITGSGDAFASPIFRKLLQTLEKKDCPNLQHMTLLTNGLLVKKYWDTLSDFAKSHIRCISVSIDAGTKETYLKNRLGGKWEDLLENLEFIKGLVSSGAIKCMTTNMVVQENNFTEIKEFVRLTESYLGKAVLLQILEPDFMFAYGTEAFENWKKKAVHEKDHPRHQELLDIIKDDWFEPFIQNSINDTYGETQINMGPLYDLRNGRDISQAEGVAQEFQNWDSNKYSFNIPATQKDVFYNDQTYIVEREDVIKVNGTDSFVLSNGIQVIWDEDEYQWVNIRNKK